MSDSEGSGRSSAEEAVARFDSAAVAAKYATTHRGRRSHRREVACILDALSGVPAGASVLDLPCGTGRMLPALAGRDFRVTEADTSLHMTGLAREHARAEGIAMEEAAFAVASVFATGFPDRHFDAVVCNRLFHHFREPEVRRRALRELARICRGPIVASFFSSRCVDALVFNVRRFFALRRITDRIPILPWAFEADGRAVGLAVRRWIAVRPLVSKQVYAVFEAAGAGPDGLSR